MKEYVNPTLEIKKLLAEDVLNISGIIPEIDFGDHDTPPESLL